MNEIEKHLCATCTKTEIPPHEKCKVWDAIETALPPLGMKAGFGIKIVNCLDYKPRIVAEAETLRYPSSALTIRDLILKLESMVANPVEYIKLALKDAEHDLKLLRPLLGCLPQNTQGRNDHDDPK